MQVRAIVDMTSVIESCVARGDAESAFRLLDGLHGLLCNQFRNQERGMTNQAGQEAISHLHRAIGSADPARLRAQVSTFVNRLARHVIEHDVPFSESLAAA